MERCPISYDHVNQGAYSARGLGRLSRRLTRLDILPYSSAELRLEAHARADKMSIQGVQPKLSAVLKVAASRFEIVDTGGRFILKPQIPDYENVPENEDVTMRMAALMGIETPLHGMIYAADGSLCYFIKRYDRLPRRRKLHVEDFAQLLGRTRDTKYNASVEQVVSTVNKFCTFPAIELVKLFRRVLLSFLVGNEDAHLKNYSIIVQDGIVGLAPAYDLVNTTIVLANAREESALPIAGKKSNLQRAHFFDYLARERMEISDAVVERVDREIRQALPSMHRLLENSFLTPNQIEAYRTLLRERAHRLELS